MKIEINPPLWDTTTPIDLVTWVMPATEEWRDPMPPGRFTLLISTVIHLPAASTTPLFVMMNAPSELSKLLYISTDPNIGNLSFGLVITMERV